MNRRTPHRLVDGKEVVASMNKNQSYHIPRYRQSSSVPSETSFKDEKSEPMYIGFFVCVLVGFVLVGGAAFISMAIMSWNISHMKYQISKLKAVTAQLQVFVNENMSRLEKKTQTTTNDSVDKLEGRIMILENHVENAVELQAMALRSLDSKINDVVFQMIHSSSCSHISLLNPSSSSGYYWIRSSNGSAVHVYCDFNRQCGCGGPSTWTRVAFLNMSDPNQVCPSNWNTISSPVRTCGRGLNSSTGCTSVFYPIFGIPYIRVCGRIATFQHGYTYAFQPSFTTAVGIDGPYLDGVSLTHSSKGSRHHIWSFASTARAVRLSNSDVCDCTNCNNRPSFVGNNFFCETINHNSTFSTNMHSDDSVFDCDGSCMSSKTCCLFNNPPWFCRTLPQYTTDDLEVRICKDGNDKDIPIQLLELYIQ